MTKVGGPGVPPPVIQPADAKTAQTPKDAKGTQAQQATGKDQFIANKAGQTPLQRLNFSSAELGNIAQGFAALLRRHQMPPGKSVHDSSLHRCSNTN